MNETPAPCAICKNKPNITRISRQDAGDPSDGRGAYQQPPRPLDMDDDTMLKTKGGTMTLPFLTKDEIMILVDPLKQPAAICRWFQNSGFSDLKIMPCGLPLVPRSFLDSYSQNDRQKKGPNTSALLQRFGKK